MTTRCKAITALIGLIYCGAAILSLSPVTVEQKATATPLSDCFSQPVKCLKSFFEDNKVEKPLLQAVLQDSISLPMIPKDYLPLYASGLAEQIYNCMGPSQPKSTKFNTYIKKSIHHITSFASSSYIACATHLKGSVVTKTTAEDENSNNNNNKADEKSTMVSSYTACAIRVKDSVVNNCHDFFVKFVNSSETSAGVNMWAWVVAVGIVVCSFAGPIRSGDLILRNVHIGRFGVMMCIIVIIIRVLMYWMWAIVALLSAAILMSIVVWKVYYCPARDAKIDIIWKLVDGMRGDSWYEWSGLIELYYERKHGRSPTDEDIGAIWWSFVCPWEEGTKEGLRYDRSILSTDPAVVVERLRKDFDEKVVYKILDSLETRIVPYDQ